MNTSIHNTEDRNIFRITLGCKDCSYSKYDVRGVLYCNHLRHNIKRDFYITCNKFNYEHKINIQK